MADLFDIRAEKLLSEQAPLAAKMRPLSLDELVGQEQIIGPGKPLRKAIEADQLSSLILYGPPGTGKTTLAKIIAGTTSRNFVPLSAVTSGIADVREMIKNAREDLKLYGKRTLLFIDEIHRFNKTQQDALLPAVEDGTVVLIGATTENPYFEVNRALLSRSRIFRLEPLSEENILVLLRRALADDKRGLASLHPQVDEDALEHLANMACGDARSAYNALELAVVTTEPDEQGRRHVDLEAAAQSIPKKALCYDKSGDWHYDVISAFIKSMRGSDPDATLHWLARMIESGEEPEFIMRRIVICAAEDVGLADPQALVLAMAASDAVHFIGWPEARIPIAEAALYVACAPKSNAAYLAIDAAMQDLEKGKFSGVPAHLRDKSYAGAKEFGHGKNYLYPHNYQGGYVAQQYLPPELENKTYYRPSEYGKEKSIKERLTELRKNAKIEDSK